MSLDSRCPAVGVHSDADSALRSLREFCEALRTCGRKYVGVADVIAEIDRRIAHPEAVALHNHLAGAELTSECDNWCKVNHAAWLSHVHAGKRVPY